MPDREIIDTRGLVTWVHCHACRREWLASGQDTACTCSASDERWAEGRSHRQVFYSRLLTIPCTGQCDA